MKKKFLALLYSVIATTPAVICLLFVKQQSIIFAVCFISFFVVFLIAINRTEKKKRYEEDRELEITKQQIREVQIQKRQEQLNALQNQINPHFLYNTLDTIRGMAYEAQADDVANIVAKLSSMFKYSLDYTDSLTRVQDEIENIDSFLSIQALRFSNSFSYKKEFLCEKEDILKTKIPKLTLQPIVENIFKHAFRDLYQGGEITLAFLRTDNNFQIIVSDNGKGMADEVQIRINQLLGDETSQKNLSADSSHSGIALRNINSRIKMNFGSDYGLRVSSTMGIGTSVSITIPGIKNET